MHIVINKMYLGIDKVHLAPMRVTKNAHWQRMHLGSVGFHNNLQFGSQFANSEHLVANYHQQGASCKCALTICTLLTTVCTLLGVCTIGNMKTILVWRLAAGVCPFEIMMLYQHDLSSYWSKKWIYKTQLSLVSIMQRFLGNVTIFLEFCVSFWWDNTCLYKT